MLSWGRHYVMVEPSHFRLDYAINPYMDLADQPDPALAMHEWRTLVSVIERSGGHVDVLPQREDSPDMVYAMNLGLGVVRPRDSGLPGPSVVMSHMRYEQRRREVVSAQPWFAEHGYSTTYVGRDGVGAHFESGDAFPWQGELIVGYGPRTDELALKHLATDLGVSVRGFRIVHPAMYHFDLVFCPLDERRAIVAPSALDAASAEALLALVPEPLILTEEENLTSFASNSIVVPSSAGKPTIVMPGCPDRVREQLEDWGFTVELVDVSEFHKGGGSVRCLTNPMDITIGRDLAPVSGGRVVLPPV
jgi:N-dimethylarginine dimethylaminohydrolase